MGIEGKEIGLTEYVSVHVYSAWLKEEFTCIKIIQLYFSVEHKKYFEEHPSCFFFSMKWKHCDWGAKKAIWLIYIFKCISHVWFGFSQ